MVERRRVSLPEPKIDLDAAHRFLTALAPGETEFHFQTFDDNPRRDEVNKKLAADGHSTLAAATKWLVNANDRHAGVFVTINETDAHGRKKENIVKVRAVMLDLDGEPLDPVRQCALKPHITTETSPGHYHVFWKMADLPLKKFEDVQRGLAKRFDGDPSVATLERCTRLPGFFWCKDIDNETVVRIVEINKHPAYSAKQILAEFPPEKKAHKASGSLKDAIILPFGAPLVAADEFVARHLLVGESIPLLRHYRGGFYLWTGTHYRQMPEEELERELYRFLNGALARKDNGALVPYKPTKGKVGEVVHALRRSALLVPEDWEAPFWLGIPTPGDKLEYKPAGELIACANGILNLETRELLPHNPLFFTANALPFDYDPDAPEPQRFKKFLEELWPADKDGKWDQEAEETLLEIIGYLLGSDTRQQKIFLIVGPKRGGKGTIVFVLELLLGRDNCVFQTMDSLTGEFGRWPLIDKKLCVFADASRPRH
jgi:RepB DNA-primase N-terminal domain/D5 N terminal like